MPRPPTRRLTTLGCLGAAALVAGVLVSTQSASAATITVAADGSGTYTTIQAAVKAASAGTVINVKKGTYPGQVVLAASKSGVTIQGATGVATDVVITGNVSQAAAGSANGSATVLNQAKDTTVKNLTIANTFGTGGQALALYMNADRQVYDNVRLLGHQDTLLTWTNSSSTTVRQYIRNSYIEGDIDFIYGNGTLVIDRSTIHSLDRNSSNNGYITAAATYANNPYGILINASTLTGPSAVRTVALGRCWHAGGATDATGQVLVRNSTLGSHIRQSGAWQDMSGFSWKTCRFTEYGNSGAGTSNGTPDRPQLSSARAAGYTPQKYLTGSDGWNPT